MNRRPPVSRCCSSVLVGVLAACQGQPSKSSPEPVPAPEITVRDASGATVATLRTSRPCRASIGGQELIVGGPPVIADVGTTKWTGWNEPNGTVLKRNDERIARVYPVGDPAQGAVFDLHGVAQARVQVTGQTATVQNAASMPVRKLTLAAGTITINDPALTVTGTDDLILAALLTAPELVPEVRMLAACERVLVLSKD